MAAMTKGLLGEEMTEIGLLREAGAIAFANGKTSLANAKVMRNVLAYAKDFGALIVHHLEDAHARQGRGHERGRGRNQARACAASPTAAETIMLERDIRLVELTGGRYHAGQISCRDSLDIVRAAKQEASPSPAGCRSTISR